jgi:hypothetical protein
VAELAELADERRLAALQMANEMPAERVAVGVALRLQVLRAVLAHHVDARLGKRGQLGERDVLRGGDNGDTRADLLADALVSLTNLSR